MFDTDIKIKEYHYNSCEPIWPDEYEEREMKRTVYKINEIFESIQGEGYYSGKPVIFIRLAGCSMGCEWCDTKSCQEIHYSLTAEQVVAHLQKNFVKKGIVITGGEPFEQELEQLICALRRDSYSISIETNGAHEIPESIRKGLCWLTVSPKKTVLSSSLRYANEIKLVISGLRDIQRAKRIISYFPTPNFYLQPESGKKEATELCVKTCLEDPRFQLSVQVHKLINIK